MLNEWYTTRVNNRIRQSYRKDKPLTVFAKFIYLITCSLANVYSCDGQFHTSILALLAYIFQVNPVSIYCWLVPLKPKRAWTRGRITELGNYWKADFSDWTTRLKPRMANMTAFWPSVSVSFATISCQFDLDQRRNNRARDWNWWPIKTRDWNLIFGWQSPEQLSCGPEDKISSCSYLFEFFLVVKLTT